MRYLYLYCSTFKFRTKTIGLGVLFSIVTQHFPQTIVAPSSSEELPKPLFHGVVGYNSSVAMVHISFVIYVGYGMGNWVNLSFDVTISSWVKCKDKALG